ncbi:hypothetical protein LTS15_009147 [Exophiala xenobiotica]|nr:hypothetical protein LTS15_009147 [Exophiala xenobiotica]
MVEVSHAPPSTPHGKKRSAPSGSAPPGSVASGLRSAKRRVASSPRRTKEEERAVGGQTIVVRITSFHFIPKDKGNIRGGGFAQFEWEGDKMLEVRVPAFETEDQRKAIVSRLLNFVTLLLETNDLRASDEFPKVVIPIQPETPPRSSSRNLTQPPPTPTH